MIEMAIIASVVGATIMRANTILSCQRQSTTHQVCEIIPFLNQEDEAGFVFKTCHEEYDASYDQCMMDHSEYFDIIFGAVSGVFVFYQAYQIFYNDDIG